MSEPDGELSDRAVLGSLSEAMVLVVDERLRIVRASGGDGGMTQHSRRWLEGRRLLDAFPLDDPGALAAAVNRGLEGDPATVVVAVGAEYPRFWRVRCSPLRAGAGTDASPPVVGRHAVLLWQDVTDAEREARRLSSENAALRSLNRATGALARATDVLAVRETLCEAALEAADADRASFLEPDAAYQYLELHPGGGPEELHGTRLPLESGLAAAVAAAGDSVFVADGAARLDPALLGAGGGAAYLAPMRRAALVTGMLILAWAEPREGIGQEQAELVDAITEEGAVALDRFRRLDGFIAASREDPLTGALNRRAWDQEIRREIARADRAGTPLTVGLLDLDDFKRFNDEHGHQAGDRLLTAFTAALQRTLRATDVLARFGGDEFALALPDCDLPDARNLSERIGASIPGEISCTIGLAQWEPGETVEELIELADRALLAAKNSGPRQPADQPPAQHSA